MVRITFDLPPSPYLPFLRLHQASSLLRVPGITKPLTEDAFATIRTKYELGTLEQIPDFPSQHPDIPSIMCGHPRHPATLTNMEYGCGRLCCVCSVREKMWKIRCLDLDVRAWEEGRHDKILFTETQYEEKCKELWATIEELDKEEKELKKLAEVEKGWKDRKWMVKTWNATIALKIIELEQKGKQKVVGVEDEVEVGGEEGEVNMLSLAEEGIFEGGEEGEVEEEVEDGDCEAV